MINHNIILKAIQFFDHHVNQFLLHRKYRDLMIYTISFSNIIDYKSTNDNNLSEILSNRIFSIYQIKPIFYSNNEIDNNIKNIQNELINIKGLFEILHENKNLLGVDMLKKIHNKVKSLKNLTDDNILNLIFIDNHYINKVKKIIKDDIIFDNIMCNKQLILESLLNL